MPYYSNFSLILGLSSALAKTVPKLLVGSVVKLAASVPCLAPWTTDKRCVDPKYLTSQLQAANLLGADNAVVAIAWAAIENGALASVYRLTVTYKDPVAATVSGAPLTIVAKVLGETFANHIVGSLIGLYNQERKSVSLLRTVVDDLQPAIFAKELPWFGVGFYLMEDYGHMRHRKTRKESMTFEEALAMASFLGTMHGRTFLDAGLAKKMSLWSPWLMHSLPANMAKIEKSRFSNQLRDECPRFFALMTDAVRNGEMFFNVHSERIICTNHIDKYPTFDVPPPQTAAAEETQSFGTTPLFVMTHGDARLDNAFFDDQNGIHMIDWQLCIPRAPVVDLVWMMKETTSDISCDPDKVDQLLTAYLTQFKKNCTHPVIAKDTMISDEELKQLFFFKPLESCLRYTAMMLITAVGSMIDEKNTEVLDTMAVSFSRLEAMTNAYVRR